MGISAKSGSAHKTALVTILHLRICVRAPTRHWLAQHCPLTSKRGENPMHFVPHFISISLLLGVSCLCLAGQGPGAPPAKGSDTATVSAATAATVNGQPIPEVALQRGLKGVPPEQQAAARTEILNRLIDNLILDQYLLQLRIDVPKKDLDNRMEQIREEIKKGGQTFEKVMQELMLTEEELRTQLQAELRWEKYASDQATDKVL